MAATAAQPQHGAWWRSEAAKCRAAYRTGGVWKARDALRDDVAELLAQLLLQAQRSGCELLSRRVLLVLSAFNPRVADAPHAQLLEVLVQEALHCALRAEPVHPQSMRAIVSLACPTPGSAAKLTRALDVLLSRSGGGGGNAPAAPASTAPCGAAAVAPLPQSPEALKGEASPPRAASPPLSPPCSAAQRRACAAGRLAADEASPVWARAPPAACADDVTLLARFHADAAAVAALPPGGAAAIVTAICGDDKGGGGSPSRIYCAEVVDSSDAAVEGPLCGIMLAPLLDARGRLLRGTCAVLHADAAGGALRAHLYRSEALHCWLRRDAPPTHPATRAPVCSRDVYWLR